MGEYPTRFEIFAIAVRQKVNPPTAVGQLPAEYIAEGNSYRNPSTGRYSTMIRRADTPNCVIMRDIGTDPNKPEVGPETVLDLTGYVVRHTLTYPFLKIEAKYWAMPEPQTSK